MESCGFGVSESACGRGIWGQNPKIIRNKENLEIDRGERIRHGMYLDPDLSDVPSVFRAPTYVSQWNLFLAKKNLICFLAICNHGVVNNKHKKLLKNIKLLWYKVLCTFKGRKIFLFGFAFRLMDVSPDSHCFLVS